MPEHVEGLVTRDAAILLCLERNVSVFQANGRREFWYIADIQEKPTKSNLPDKRRFFCNG